MCSSSVFLKFGNGLRGSTQEGHAAMNLTNATSEVELSGKPQHALSRFAQPSSSQTRALIIEDEETDCFQVMTMCRRAGLNLDVHTAADAFEFRAEIAATAFDLIFVDYHFGLLTGLEVLSEINSCDRQAQAVLIMVTSVTKTDIVVEAMKSGCSDYLIKEQLSVAGIRKSVETAFADKSSQVE